MSVRETILDALRVPPKPSAPPGSPPRVFRAAPNFMRLRMLEWGLTQLAAIAGLAFAIVFVSRMAQTDLPRAMIWLLRIGEFFGILAVAARFLFGWLTVRYDFELRWYMLSDRAIRIREGIMTIREKTIALANIQNISIRQGPLQRALGIADVEVKTAGGGGASTDSHGKGKIGEPLHVAYFRGVANAEEIRDLVREGVRRQRNSGLGDPDEVGGEGADQERAARRPGDAPAPPPTAHLTDVDAAVGELVAEARALRAAVVGRE